MIKLIATDMDGTFLKGNNDYNRDRFHLIYQIMKQKGIKFVVASGNQYHQLKSFFPEIAHEISFVAENGALIICEGHEIFCAHMDDMLRKKILDFILQLPHLQIIMCGRKNAYVRKAESAGFIDFAKIYFHNLVVTENLYDVSDDVIFKFSLLVSEQQSDNMMKMLQQQLTQEVQIVNCGFQCVDINLCGVNKASGLDHLQARWNIQDDQIAVFGDSGNDIEMLQKAGCSYAMNHASEEVKAAAKKIIGSNDEEAVLAMLEELMEFEGV